MARILLVSSRYRPPYFRGGVERYVHVLGSILPRFGYDCAVVAFEEPIECKSDVPHNFVAAARIPFLRPLLFGWAGRRLWKSTDLIVLQYTPLGVLMPKRKLVCTVHTTGYGEAQALKYISNAGVSGWWHRARRFISLPLERYVLTRAQRVLAISEHIVEELVDTYRVPRARISVVGNGVDCEEFRPDSELKGRTPFRVLYVGRLAARKNVHALIRAMARCQASVELRIVGTGPELRRLEELTTDLGIGTQVTFRGFRAGPELLAEYQWADLLVMPSSYEGLPLVALEAKAVGVPIVAANFAGASRVVSERSGWILRDVTPETLALAIEDAASDRERLNQMSVSARREAVENFSWNFIARELARHYDAVLQRSNAR